MARNIEIEPVTWGPFRNSRVSRYTLTVVEIAARHLLIVRAHDGVTVHVTGDASNHLRGILAEFTADNDAARGIVESGAAYVGIDILFVHPAIEAQNANR